MKKAMTVMAMVIALAMSTMAGAFADEHGSEEGRQGNNTCYLNATGETYDTPGEMFRAIRSLPNPGDEQGKSLNPNQWVQYWAEQAAGNGNFDHPQTVAEFIYRNCVEL